MSKGLRTEPVLLYGAGGFAREAAWHIERAQEDGRPLHLVGFIDDAPVTHGQLQNGYPVMAYADALVRHPDARWVVAIGDPAIRRRLVERLIADARTFATILHPAVDRPKGTPIGEGTVIMVGVTITTNVVIGRHVQINPGCTIAHDVIIGDYVTITPGAHISGAVVVESGAYIGTGAVIVQSRGTTLRIGSDAVVGAGAVVLSSVASGTTVAGVPARPLER